jgi:hypothetical protein
MSAQTSSQEPLPDRDRALVRAAALLIFLVAALAGAVRKDITLGFDEVAHVSYAAQIQKSGEAWPALDSLRLMAPRTFRFSETPNYLNHPPPYYWLMARLGPQIAGHPDSLLFLRLINVALVSMGFAALIALGRCARLTRLEEYAWLMPLFAAPALAPLAGAVNNDNLAFAGGAVALFAAHRLLTTRADRWLIATLAAMIVAGLAKLTGLLLVGGLVAGVLAAMVWRGRHRGWWLPAAFCAALIAAAPYLVFWAQYGGPAPDTPGQIALLKSTAPEIGWEHAPRQDFPAYAATFATSFVAQWMPTLAERGPFQYAMLAAPILALACAFAGLAVSARRLRRGEDPSATLVVAGFAALGVTFLCHLFFSYRHHLAYAYIADAYPRYYLPLGALVPLAGIALLSEIRSPAWRAQLAALLIGGPVALALFGAP